MKTLEESIKERKNGTPLQRLMLCYGCPYRCTLDQRLSDWCMLDVYCLISMGISLIKKMSAKPTDETAFSSAPPANRGVENT